MFGNITSSWSNPQQNQQPQQQPGAFGQPTGFGTSGTNTFGQNQPQPQANPMFGNLGGNTNTGTGTTGFGAFGGTANNSQGTSSIFGASKPATGFGAFGGGGSTFGSGAFGQGTNTANTASGSGTTSGLFGQPTTNTTGAFGGGLFGANKATTFGTTTTGGSPGTTNPVTTGSSNPPYSVFTEKDSNVTLQYQSISCMPAYNGTSHEEIRLQDYAQGRKTAGTFGQSATFGGAQPTNAGLFGTQPAQQNPQPPAFGGSTTTGGFGTFGAPAANTSTPAPASTLFGGGTFGQPQPQQPQGFGTFGTTQQPQQQTGGLFGNTGNAFGNATSKPSGFSTFGGGNTGGMVFGSGGTFGQQNQQQPQQPQQPTGTLFGSTPAPATTGFGAFGNNANKSIFGGNQSTTTQPSTTGFGGFGSNQLQQPQQSQTQQPSLFGGGGLFGNNNNQQQPGVQQPTTNTLFGGTTGQTGGTGLFGGFNSNNNQQSQQGQTGGFGSFGGNKPAAPPGQLFGGFNQQPTGNAPQQSLFGGSLGQSGNQSSTLGGGLFGNKPTVPLGLSTSTGQGGLFGSTNTPNGFNSSTNAPGTQSSLTASISQPIGADLNIFDMLPPGPRLVNLESSQPKKKAGFFVDIPTRSPVPRVQLGYTPANSKLRGFGSSTSISSFTGGNPFAASLSLGPGKSNALSLSRVNDNKASGPDGFLLGRSSSPSLGSGGKQSVKKVILDKKVDPSELFIKTGSPGLRGGKVVFSPALSISSREKDAVAALNPPPNGVSDSPSPAPRPQRTPNRFTAQSTQQLLQDKTAAEGSTDLEEGDYWVKPDLGSLKQTGYDQLSSFKDLIVGRVGYGEIHFLEPVDLTGLPKLSALLGEVVRFDDKECSVYPDSEEVEKPPPGSGLNVRARLILLRCWAVDKATREPIKDATHSAAVKHLKRLKNMKDTHFESFDITDGKWTFSVDHF